MSAPEIRIRSWVKASDADRRTGLEGYISVVVGLIVIDGIVLRRTADGRHTLSFPARTSRRGERHAIIRPIDDQARQAIEHHLLAELSEMEEFAS